MWGLTGAALLTFLVGRAWLTQPLTTLHPAGWALGPFLFYAALNVVFVSPVPWLGSAGLVRAWVNLAVTFWVGLNALRSHACRWATGFVLTGLGLAAVGLGCYQVFVQPDWLLMGRHQAPQFIGRASGPFGIPNTLAGLLILLLPAAGALAWRGSALGRIWWGWVTAVMTIGLFLTFSREPGLSLALALVAWPFFATRRAWPRRLAIAGVVLGGLIAVTMFVHGSSPQARERLDRLLTDAGELSRSILMARSLAAVGQSEPLFGTGAGSFNVLFERHRPAGFVDEPQWAHNEYLNTLSDYGLIGLGLSLGRRSGWCGTRGGVRRADVATRAWRNRRTERGGQPGGGVPGFCAAIGGRLPSEASGPRTRFRPSRRAGRGIGGANQMVRTAAGSRTAGGRAAWLAMVCLVGIGLFLACVGSRRRRGRSGARGSLERELRHVGDPRLEVLQRAETELRRAVALWPRHGGAWADLAHALQFQAYVEPTKSRPLAEPAEAAARRALALAEVVPEFWLRLGIALDMQGRRADAISAYERALQLAPRSATGWYYYADHLSRDTKTREAALRAIATCLSLDPGNADAEALRGRLSPVP